MLVKGTDSHKEGIEKKERIAAKVTIG